jgi:integrase
MASFKQLPDRTWIFRFRPVPGAPERQVRKDDSGQPFKTKRDAERFHAAIATATANGTFIDPKLGRETFRSFYVRWAASQVWETNTRAAYRVAVKCVTFADVPLKDINQQHIEQWVSAMARGGLAASTRKARMRNIGKVFRAAGPNGYKLIPGNPMANVKAPREDQAASIHAVRRDEIPEPAVVGQWISAATGQNRALFALCAFAGLRGSEACGVQLGDFDFMHRTLTVNRQVARAGKDQDGNLVESAPGSRIQIRRPKYGSVRTIDIPAALLDIVNTHLAEYGTLGDDQWLFRSGRRDTPPTITSIEYAIKVVRAAVPAVKVFHTHSLRHFYASALIDAGCGIAEVQQAMGHANTSTTLDTYTHLFRRSEDRTRAAMAGVMAAAFADPSRDSLRIAE